jgi:hypothetical protein
MLVPENDVADEMIQGMRYVHAPIRETQEQDEAAAEVLMRD